MIILRFKEYLTVNTRSLSIVYDIVGSTSDRNCVVLNNIHIDVMDYIQPATCTNSEFRKMWAEFEWENKVCAVPVVVVDIIHSFL